MMPTKTDVQTLVALLSNGMADSTLFDDQYNDVVGTLGPTRWHTTTSSVNLTEATNLITLPSTLLNLLGLIYDGAALSNLELRELESLNAGWRNVTGTPIAFTLDAEKVQTAEVYPAPYTTSPPTITAIYVETRTNVLPILTLPVALLVLQTEFVRESNHTDTDFGNLCGALATLLLQLLSTPDNGR